MYGLIIIDVTISTFAKILSCRHGAFTYFLPSKIAKYKNYHYFCFVGYTQLHMHCVHTSVYMCMIHYACINMIHMHVLIRMYTLHAGVCVCVCIFNGLYFTTNKIFIFKCSVDLYNDEPH